MASTSSTINSIKANLDRLANDAKTGGPDAKQKIILINAQRKQLQQRVQRFRTIEQVYRDKVRERAIRQYQIGTHISPMCKSHANNQSIPTLQKKN